MSQLPSRTQPASSTDVPNLQAVPTATAKERTQALMATVGRAAATIGARALGFGVLGLFLGLVAFIVEKSLGLLDHPGAYWGALVYVLLPAYMGVGAVGLGGAGLWRGLGRAAMDLVERHQLSQRLVDRVMDRAARLAAGASTPDVLHKPLPIQKLRELLHRASGEDAQSDEPEQELRGFTRTLARWVRRRVTGLVESRLDVLIGEREKDESAVELTLGRVRELAREHLDAQVLDTLDGLRNKQALLWSALFVGGVSLAPVLLLLMR